MKWVIASFTNGGVLDDMIGAQRDQWVAAMQVVRCAGMLNSALCTIKSSVYRHFCMDLLHSGVDLSATFAT